MVTTERGLTRLATRLMAERTILPEGRSGEISLKHHEYPAGHRLMLVPMRTAFHTGLPVMDYVCPRPTVVQSLCEGNGVWMTDLPCELVQMRDELASAVRDGDRVLIGGLGLGILPRMLAFTGKPAYITVVEQSLDVANLVWPHLERTLYGKGRLVMGDVHAQEWRRNKYDVALMDTWQMTGEITWTRDVVPIRRRLARVGVRRVRCWHEQVMLNQVVRGIMHASACTESWYEHLPVHYYAFVRGLDRLRIERERSDDQMEAITMGYRNNELGIIKHMAYTFLKCVGSKDWEHWFGEAWNERAARDGAP